MFDDVPEDLSERAIAFIRHRLSNGAPLGRAVTPADLDILLDGAINETGLGVVAAWDLFETAIVPNCVGLDSERYLAFIPAAPSPTSIWFDAVVGASTFSGEAWIEASGAIHAENQALRFLADLVGLPPGAGGVFVTGGSAGNLSALAVGRDHGHRRGRLVAVGDTVHASVDNALRILGMEAFVVPTGPDGRFTAEALDAALRADARRDDVSIVVASAGSTNLGIIDDLEGIGELCNRDGRWFHVDGAYGGGATISPRFDAAFAGIARADSYIVDPHKWLFSTLDCCALIYREPHRARRTHTQHGPYLDVLHVDDAWNPADYAYHLTRRTRGLPFWFGLAVHGAGDYRRAVERALDLTQLTAERLRSLPGVELVAEPELSVLVFRRDGWDPSRWRQWAVELLERQIAFVAPTTWRGETAGRVVFLHPRTPHSIIDELADSVR